MALKALMLNHKRQRLQQERAAIPDRSAEFATRQAQLEQAIAEATTEEEETVVSVSVAEFEQERNAHNANITRLENEIADLTRQIQELEAAEPPAPPAADPIDPNHPTTAPPVERKDDPTMPNTRGRFFGLSRSQFEDLVKRDEVSKWLSDVRAIAKQTRSVSNADVLIPDRVIGLIRENVPLYSKLYKHVDVRSIRGTVRLNVMGAIPEAIWTEMCATLNEMHLSFSTVVADGFKVGGFIPVCNAVLSDSDVNLANEIIQAITKAIAKALDKAIAYGTGNKMPVGFITRLLQKSKPDGYKNSIPWKDLTSTNVFVLGNKSGLALFQALNDAAGAISTQYGDGEMVWIMNRKTKMKLRTQAMSISAVGAIVSGVDNTMPIVGGTIEVLDWMPDDIIGGGIGDMYLLIEREGIEIARSEHVQFIQDNTVFKGTARYDGLPVIAESWIVLSLGETAPTADAVSFEPDAANATA